MQRLYENAKIDLGLVPQALNNSNVTGRYFHMRDYRKALSVLSVGAMAAGTTAKLELFEALDAAGTGGALITGATATITANANVTRATVALASVLNTQTVTINGVTFSAHTDTTTAADRQFAIDGDNAADAAALAGLINDPVYGVPGVTATVNSATITLTVADPGSRTLTISASHSTFTIATVEALAYVEVENDAMTAGYGYLAAKVTVTANTTVAVALHRGNARESITQHVGAAAAA